MRDLEGFTEPPDVRKGIRGDQLELRSDGRMTHCDCNLEGLRALNARELEREARLESTPARLESKSVGYPRQDTTLSWCETAPETALVVSARMKVSKALSRAIHLAASG
jgi:hypothetical protein